MFSLSLFMIELHEPAIEVFISISLVVASYMKTTITIFVLNVAVTQLFKLRDGHGKVDKGLSCQPKISTTPYKVSASHFGTYIQ